MGDKEQSPTTAAVATTRSELNATESADMMPHTGVREEDKTRSTSVSPPPAMPTATMPSALAGQSVATPPVQPSPPPAPETLIGAQDESRDPQVAALKAIFPDYDDAVLQSVLESVGADQDRAIDLLLGMSDPNFKSETQHAAPVQQPQMTQEELDEQLARRLMFEEQQEAQQRQQQYRQRPQRRSSHPQQSEQQQQQTTPPMGGKDTMTEFQEQFTKIAETGKKTFGAFMTKVKAKIQEYDKPNPDASGSGVQPTWGSANSASYYDPNTTTPPPRTNYQTYHGHSTASGIHSPPIGNPANTAILQPAAFYDPNPSPQPMSPPPTQHGSPNLGERQMQPIVVEGYDVTPLPTETNTAPGSSSGSVSQPAQSTAAGASSGSGFAASVPPRGPSPGNPIDGGKLGLLPKRPISLVRDPPHNQSQQAQRRNSDDDDLEYAESPFDDDRK